MKSFKILFTFAFVLCFGMSYGQITVNASNNVGVGTSTPAAPLDVLGTLKLSATPSDPSGTTLANSAVNNFQINKNSAAGNTQIDISPRPSEAGANAKFRFFRLTNTTGQVAFDVHVGNNTAQVNSQFAGNGNSYLNRRFGNVGIGTNNPSQKFHVEGNTLLDGDLTVTGTTMLQDPNGGTVSLVDVINEQQQLINDLREELSSVIETVERLEASASNE